MYPKISKTFERGKRNRESVLLMSPLPNPIRPSSPLLNRPFLPRRYREILAYQARQQGASLNSTCEQVAIGEVKVAPGPKLPAEALDGLAGGIVRSLASSGEADPAGALLQ